MDWLQTVIRYTNCANTGQGLIFPEIDTPTGKALNIYMMDINDSILPGLELRLT